jgi:inner membrane protein
VIPKQILLLAVIAVTSHPLLDFLNSYGMRFLAPFSYRWFYGDTLFIIDPWVWVALAAGCWAGRRATQAPKLALTVATLYVALMAASNVAARAVIKQTALREGSSVQRVMAAPAAVTPFTRWVVVEDASGYQVGLFSWLPRPSVDLERLPYERDPSGPAMTAAASELGPRKFLAWARFPYFLAQRRGDATEVHIGDARYTLDPEGSWASTSVTIRLTDQ